MSESKDWHPSRRDKRLAVQLRYRAGIVRERGDFPSAKVMLQAADRLAQIEREAGTQELVKP